MNCFRFLRSLCYSVRVFSVIFYCDSFEFLKPSTEFTVFGVHSSSALICRSPLFTIPVKVPIVWPFNLHALLTTGEPGLLAKTIEIARLMAIISGCARLIGGQNRCVQRKVEFCPHFCSFYLQRNRLALLKRKLARKSNNSTKSQTLLAVEFLRGYP